MPTHNVNLPDQQSRFIQQRIKSGRYQNASEVVRAGLRLLEQQEAEDKLRLKALRQIAQDAFDGLDRGESTTLTPDALDEYLKQTDRAVGRR